MIFGTRFFEIIVSLSFVTIDFHSPVKYNACVKGDYVTWDYTNSSIHKHHMKCPDWCKRDPNKYVTTRDECCLCYAKPLWEVPVDITKKLDVEYTRRSGKAVIYEKEPVIGNSYLTLHHQQGFLSEIPVNICDFTNLVKIDLQENHITSIGNISCLTNLDTLVLSYNKIEVVETGTFTGMSNLRILRVTHNGLKVLGPSAITGSTLQIFTADFSNNDMKTIEFSNIVTENDFCEMQFTNNKIDEIINTNNFKIDPNKRYPGGMIGLRGNSFEKFIDFGKIGITDLRLIGKVIDYGFDIREIKWKCDCSMEPFLELAKDVVKRIWRNYFNATCHNPPEYRGWTIPSMIDGHLDLLICNLTREEKCPKDCYCFYQPREKRTVVNCTGAGLTELPKYVPEYGNLTLVFKNNNITNFENRTYLQNASVIDISNNLLTTISPGAIEHLRQEVSLNLTGSNLKVLPRDFSKLKPCQQNFGEMILQCNCENKWMLDWLKNNNEPKCSNISAYFCETKNGKIPTAELSLDDFCKSETERPYTIEIILAIGSIVTIGISSFLYVFRYEIYLIRKKLFDGRKSKYQVEGTPKYDAFLSFNDENNELRIWVMNDLVTNLELAGYKIFVPCRDLPIGAVKEEHLLDNITNSKHFLVLLCDYYKFGGTPWTEIEWKYIWHSFKDHSHRKVIIINFDHIEVKENIDLKLRAFVRLGYDIDFSNRKRDLLKTVKERLGQPFKSFMYNRNAKTKFKPENLKLYNYIQGNNFVLTKIQKNKREDDMDEENVILPDVVSLKNESSSEEDFIIFSEENDFTQENVSFKNIHITC